MKKPETFDELMAKSRPLNEPKFSPNAFIKIVSLAIVLIFLIAAHSCTKTSNRQSYDCETVPGICTSEN